MATFSVSANGRAEEGRTWRARRRWGDNATCPPSLSPMTLPRRCCANASAVFVLAVALSLQSHSATAQTRDARPVDAVPVTTASLDWEVGIGYPDAVAVGGQVFLGRSRLASIPGRGAHLKGVEVGATVGLGAASARVSWAQYFKHDVGPDGWSADVLYVRPWVLAWAHRGDPYVGLGGSWRAAYLKVSGAILVNGPRGRRQIVPAVQATMLMPPW